MFLSTIHKWTDLEHPEWWVVEALKPQSRFVTRMLLGKCRKGEWIRSNTGKMFWRIAILDTHSVLMNGCEAEFWSNVETSKYTLTHSLCLLCLLLHFVSLFVLEGLLGLTSQYDVLEVLNLNQNMYPTYNTCSGESESAVPSGQGYQNATQVYMLSRGGLSLTLHQRSIIR